MKKILTIVLLFSATAAFAQTAMPRFEIPTARSNGMGGTHVAYTDNVFSLLVNPAAMMRVRQRSFFALSPVLFNPQTTFGLIGPITDATSGSMSALGDAADILSEQKGKISTGFDLSEFPLSIAWVADGFGFGLWDRVFINPNIVGTNIVMNAYADVILPVSFAFRILRTGTHDVDAGITVKPFARALVSETLRIIDLADNFDMDSLSAPLIAGVGFDLGFLYRWDLGLSAGLTFSDIYTGGSAVTNFLGESSDAYIVPFSLNWGVAYDFKLGDFWEFDSSFLSRLGFTFAFDWRNFNNVFVQNNYLVRNSALDIGMGLKVTMWDILHLRIGMNECLPSFGIGVDAGSFEIDIAYYGREFGLEPGHMPAAALELTVAFRPKAKERDWPWARRSLVSLITGQEDFSPPEETNADN
jgi:hypothetical protein